ncbi:MAG TPA: pitrilysin family protein [Candidatus Omnitrophota bacterium]|mgnify:CR=1 FL=1|nr:pitrilysin family protein [Candidatus Omnitrophota bacterium]
MKKNLYRKTKLDNGVRLISCPMKDRKSLALGIWVSVGSRYEEPHSAGISHYLEHMVFKGTRNYTCRQIKESIEGVGGSFNGFTSEEVTCYFVKMPSRYLDRSLDILSDMVAQPLLRDEDIRKERTVILEEIKMYKDQPQSYVYELLDGLLWPDHPLGTSTLGSERTVGSIDRQALRSYRSRCYSPANIVVSAAGAFDHGSLAEKVRACLGGLTGGQVNRFLPARPSQKAPQVRILAKDTEQSHLVVGFHGLKRNDPMRYCLSLLHIVLGANSSSRLFNEVREKRGLAYEIGTHVKFMADTGVFIVHAGVDNTKVENTVRLVFDGLQEIRDGLVGADELKRAKEYYLGQLTLAMEDTMDQMLWIGETTTTLDTTFSLDDIVREVKKVTANDIRGAARLLLRPDRINFAMIGPWKNKERVVQKWFRLK